MSDHPFKTMTSVARAKTMVIRHSHLSVAKLALLLILFCAVVGLLDLISIHAVPGNSDGATVLLEGKSMSAGNLTLHGWHLSLDSFWGIDAPVYAIGVLIAGVRPVLLNFIPALFAAFIVLIGAFMAREGRRGAAAIVGIVTVFALIGLPTHGLAVFYLQGPLHVGTVLWCLIAFALLSQNRSRWGWVGAVAFLAAGCLGDAQTLLLGVVPVFLGGLVAMRRCHHWRAGIAAVSASGASILLALLVRVIALGIGTFTTGKTNAAASAHERIVNLRLVPNYLAKLLGVGNQGFGSGGAPGLLSVVHVVGLAVLISGVLLAFVRLVCAVGAPKAAANETQSWRLDDMLVLAFIGAITLFVFLTPTPIVSYARYLTSAVILGSILAGRAMAQFVASMSRETVARIVTGASIALTAAFSISIVYNVAQPLPDQPTHQLVQFLNSHGLHNGIGDYWSASIVTAESSNHVKVRPVISTPSGSLTRYPKNSNDDWYKDTGFTFLVYNPALPFGNVDAQTATHTFGKPTHIYAVNGYFVLVWPYPLAIA